jgi:hypothetical protein
MDKNTHQEIVNYIQEAIKRRAQTTRAAKIGQIKTVQPGKRYNILTPDGDHLWESVPNSVPNITWKEGQWVTFEFNGQDWAITGTSPLGSGNVT